MLKHSLLLAVISTTFLSSPCFAQGSNFYYDETTLQQQSNAAAVSAAEIAAAAALAAQAANRNTIVPQMRNGLPPTSLDSFVANSGYNDAIYGDEGTDGLPPYFGFDSSHRINSGIYGMSASGLTTGHSSYLPDAWGGDEFTGNEWSMSGSGATLGNSTYAPNLATQLAIQALMNILALDGVNGVGLGAAIGASMGGYGL